MGLVTLRKALSTLAQSRAADNAHRARRSAGQVTQVIGERGFCCILEVEMAEYLQEILTAALVLAVAATLFWLARRYRAAASNRRMRAMMLKVGLDPDIDLSQDLEDVVQSIRRRCYQCGAVGECEAWLEGGGKGARDFCPNARVFDILLRHRREDA